MLKANEFEVWIHGNSIRRNGVKDSFLTKASKGRKNSTGKVEILFNGRWHSTSNRSINNVGDGYEAKYGYKAACHG